MIQRPTSSKLDTEVKVGLFITCAVLLTMVALIVLGGSTYFFSKRNHYATHFPSVDGLIVGAKVSIAGLQIGVVDEIDFDETQNNLRVRVTVAQKFANWIRQDSTSEIVTHGLLGDKYLSITQGTPASTPLPDGGEIPHRISKGISQYLSEGDQLMGSLKSITATLDRILKSFEADQRNEILFQSIATTSKNLALTSEKLNQQLDQIQLQKTLKNLEEVIEKINNGSGTLGALINDPTLYYDVKTLVGGVNRNRVVRNLVRKTLHDAKDQQ